MKRIAVLLALLLALPLSAQTFYFGPDGPVKARKKALAELVPYEAPAPGLALEAESVTYLGGGAYSITRTVVNRGEEAVSFNDCLKVRDIYGPTRFTIPCVNYNGNDYDGGSVVYNGYGLGKVKVPTGISCEGEPWVFSYQRTGIPSCTLTENASVGLALFAANDTPSSLVSSCSLEQDAEGNLVHVIVRPVVEAPYTYASKGVFGPRYEEKITLEPGATFTATSYLCVCVPRYGNYAVLSLMEQALRLLDTRLEISLDDNKVWSLAQRYVRSLLYKYNDKWLTATNRKQRMFSLQHKALLSPEQMKEMQQWDYWTDVATFLPGFEIGWAGHNFLNGRMLAVEALEKGDTALLEKAVGIFDAFVATQRENGLLFVRYQQNDEADAPAKYSPDVCNLGWGAQEAVRMYKLLKEHGIEKPELLEFARRLCGFFMDRWSDEVGFGKSWHIDGTPDQTTGSIGGFLIPAMLELYDVTGKSAYLNMAIKASDFYYGRDLDRFVCTAGAIDCNCIDKETSYPFLQSSLQLYRITGEKKYLDRAQKAAAYFCSWMFFFDPVYGEETDFMKYGWHATGGTAVSAEHHAIDAWGGIMAPDLIELSRLTGNSLWERLGRLMWANAVQGITTELGEFVHGMPRPVGAQNEAFSQARFNKYRPAPDAGYWNDLLVAWPQSYRLWTLDRLRGMGVTLKEPGQKTCEQTARPVPDWFRTGLTYQIMPRSMSEEGTLKGAQAQLERLRDLGVNTVYLLPVNVADTDPNPDFWSKRQHKSGFNDPRNPYRAGDYFHVDPEYGTDEDLRDFVDRTHELGMKVLLDLVFFHCGPSAGVLKRHPEYFRHNPDGSLMLGEWHFPTFDYDNPATRAYLKSIMAYYVADFDVDGFRLDVADQVPLDFWEEARDMLDALRPGLVLAAEGDRPENTLKAMDVNYNFQVCRKLRKMVSDHFKRGGVMDISQIRKAHEDYMSQCPRGTLVWNYSENHDTATDSYDNRMEKCYGYQFNTMYLAFCFALDGVPFIVNGQEACYDKRISLFGHKDCWIDWDAALSTPQAQERQANIREWARMRRSYSSLTSGKTVWLDNNYPESVCSFVRSDGVARDVYFVGNFSAQKRKVRLSDGHKITLEPWSFFFGPLPPSPDRARMILPL